MKMKFTISLSDAVNLYFFFFIAYLQKCSEFNKLKVGNNTDSNFSSSFRPRNLGGTYARFFHCENNKTHIRYPINLNDQTRKIYGEQQLTYSPVQLEKNCVFNSASTTSRGYHESFLAVSLRLLLFTSQTKKEENHAPRRLVAHASRDSCTLTFFRQDSLRV